MGASSSKSSSEPVDMTPEAFKQLQGPFGKVIGNMIGKFAPQGVEAIMGGYQGKTTAATTGNEKNLLSQLMQKTGTRPAHPDSGTRPTPVMDGAQPQPQPGLPQQVQPQPSQQSSNILAQTAASGGSAANANQFVDELGLGPQSSLTDFQSGVAGASQTGAFGGANANPFSQAYIDQAQRQTMQNLEETLSRTLPGRFTQAGHIIQPQGSSAFDRAAAIASRGATQEMGDIATRISYQNMADAQNREAASLQGELGRRGEGDARIAAAKQAQLDRALQVPGMEADIAGKNAQTGLTGAQTGLTNAQTGTQNAQTGLTQAQVQGQEVDTLVKNLQAQALPRLIQDLGVERGMEAFNNQVNSLLSTLGIAAGVTRPVVSQKSDSSSGSMQLK
jgi:hypothetical protein